MKNLTQNPVVKVEVSAPCCSAHHQSSVLKVKFSDGSTISCEGYRIQETAPTKVATPAPAEPTLAVGDIVTLNSGSPRMTVLKLHSDGKAECTWFESSYSGAPLFFSSQQTQKYLTVPIAALVKDEVKKVESGYAKVVSSGKPLLSFDFDYRGFGKL
jgi:uncharacterized protein YodC (DUF2158 family)